MSQESDLTEGADVPERFSQLYRQDTIHSLLDVAHLTNLCMPEETTDYSPVKFLCAVAVDTV